MNHVTTTHNDCSDQRLLVVVRRDVFAGEAAAIVFVDTFRRFAATGVLVAAAVAVVLSLVVRPRFGGTAATAALTGVASDSTATAFDFAETNTYDTT